ncbi:unnamed protein product [Hymenolepis diminuta]|uniref:Uncharacterized protein n=1 Tax=Hymenolepis diminuta TaxID=6216 RepID=A0A564YM70_HYMDI|nr:unnamed protein product [Hymenolepis diminuta]
MYVDPYLQLDGHKIKRVISYAFLGSAVNDKDLADDAAKLEIMKARRRMVFSVNIPAKLLETFVEGVLYGFSTIVHRKFDNNKLKSIRKRARRIMLGPYSR